MIMILKIFMQILLNMFDLVYNEMYSKAIVATNPDW